jgi:hypothetical protein
MLEHVIVSWLVSAFALWLGSIVLTLVLGNVTFASRHSWL